jgi:hypothetical protein
MITKGEIKSIDYNDNTCLVRIPIFEGTNYVQEAVLPAIFVTAPGVINGYQAGDIVMIAFENNDISQPVVLGKLYLGAANEATDRGLISCESLTVATSASLPVTTDLNYDVGSSSSITVGVPLDSYKSILDVLAKLQQHSNEFLVVKEDVANITSKMEDLDIHISDLNNMTEAKLSEAIDTNTDSINSLRNDTNASISSLDTQIKSNAEAIVNLSNWQSGVVEDINSISSISLKATESEAELKLIADWQRKVENGEIKSIADITATASDNYAKIEQIAEWQGNVEGDIASIASISTTASDAMSQVEILSEWKSNVETDVSSISSIKSTADSNKANLELIAEWQGKVESGDIESIAEIKSTASDKYASLEELVAWKSSMEDEDNVESIVSIKKTANVAISEIQQITEWKSGVNESIATITSTAEADRALISGKASLNDITAELVIGVINDEPTAKISADRLDIEGKTLDIKVDATNITGSLTIGQLPNTVAEKTDIPDIPTKVSDLDNDTGYLTETGVVSIVDGKVTADYVSGLGCNFSTGQIGAWVFDNGMLRSSTGVSGTFYQSAKVNNSGGLSNLVAFTPTPITGYAFTALQADGLFYIIKEGPQFTSNTKATIPSYAMSSYVASSNGGGGGGVMPL